MPIRDFLFGIEKVLNLIALAEKQEDDLLDFFEVLSQAIIETREWMQSSPNKASAKISNLWFKAFRLSKKTKIYKNSEFPRWLEHKSRFWQAPIEWRNEPASFELIKSLEEIEVEIENIRGYLNL